MWQIMVRTKEGQKVRQVQPKTMEVLVDEDVENTVKTVI
jgi:hypothetical protein